MAHGARAGWDVKVVIPSSQKSWIGTSQISSSQYHTDAVRAAGKAYHIKDIINGRYYYPRDPGKHPEKARSRRRLTGCGRW